MSSSKRSPVLAALASLLLVGAAPATIERVSDGNGDSVIDVSDSSTPHRIDGRGGNDVLIGSQADDRISGGRGDDLLAGNAGDDALIGGPGFDTASLSGSIFGHDWEPGKGNTWVVTDLDPSDGDTGRTTLKQIELVTFDDHFFYPEVGDEVVIAATSLTDEDTVEATVEAFDFDGDVLQFVGATLRPDGDAIALELLGEEQGHVAYGGSSAEFVIGFAPLRPAEFFQWQSLGSGDSATEPIRATVASIDADGVESFFDVFFELVIGGVNDPPVATNGAYTADEMLVVLGAFGGIDLNDHFSDVDAGDTHTFSLTQTAGDAVPYTLSGDGLITFTDVVGGESATYQFTVADTAGESSTATLEVSFGAPPETGILIDFEGVDLPETNAAHVAEVDGFNFSGFAWVVETDEHPDTRYAAGSVAPGSNLIINAFRQTIWFWMAGGTDLDGDGDIDHPDFDFDQMVITGLTNGSIDPVGATIEVIGYLDGQPGGTFNEVGRITITLTGEQQLVELPSIFDQVDYVRFVPQGGLRFGLDNLFLMPVEDVF